METTIEEYLSKELGLDAQELEQLTRTEDGRKFRTVNIGYIHMRWNSDLIKDGDIIRIGRLMFIVREGHLNTLNV